MLSVFPYFHELGPKLSTLVQRSQQDSPNLRGYLQELKKRGGERGERYKKKMQTSLLQFLKQHFGGSAT